MHVHGPCCSCHRRSRSCVGLENVSESGFRFPSIMVLPTSGLVLACDGIEAFGDLLQLNLVSLSMANNNGLDKTVGIV